MPGPTTSCISKSIPTTMMTAPRPSYWLCVPKATIPKSLSPTCARITAGHHPRLSQCQHHECIFHACQNAQKHIKDVYGPRYAIDHPEAALLKQKIYHIFDTQVFDEAQSRYHEVLQLKNAYVIATQMPLLSLISLNVTGPNYATRLAAKQSPPRRIMIHTAPHWEDQVYSLPLLFDGDQKVFVPCIWPGYSGQAFEQVNSPMVAQIAMQQSRLVPCKHCVLVNSQEARHFLDCEHSGFPQSLVAALQTIAFPYMPDDVAWKMLPFPVWRPRSFRMSATCSSVCFVEQVIDHLHHFPAMPYKLARPSPGRQGKRLRGSAPGSALFMVIRGF